MVKYLNLCDHALHPPPLRNYLMILPHTCAVCYRSGCTVCYHSPTPVLYVTGVVALSGVTPPYLCCTLQEWLPCLVSLPHTCAVRYRSGCPVWHHSPISVLYVTGVAALSGVTPPYLCCTFQEWLPCLASLPHICAVRYKSGCLVWCHSPISMLYVTGVAALSGVTPPYLCCTLQE